MLLCVTLMALAGIGAISGKCLCQSCMQDTNHLLSSYRFLSALYLGSSAPFLIAHAEHKHHTRPEAMANLPIYLQYTCICT